MKTIIIYGTPAYGHINPTLYMVQKLVMNNYKVIYYATDEFRDIILQSGAVYKKYNIDTSEINLQDGSRILKFYRSLLQYTNNMIDELIKECEFYKPDLIIHDSVATWGRHVAYVKKIKCASFNTIISINDVFSKACILYSINFMKTFFTDINEVSEIVRQKNKLKKKYKLKKLGLIDTMMNKEKLNIMSYSREMQPGGKKFNNTYFFLGPSSICRRQYKCDDFIIGSEKIIYVSLGTIFNDDIEFFKILIEKLKGCKYKVVISAGRNAKYIYDDLPDNLIIRSYVNQSKVLKNSAVFITAGGMNSINEAIKYNVPCLIYPKQGEQKLNALILQKLKLGTIIKDIKNIDKEVEKILGKYDEWNYKLAEKISKVDHEGLLGRIEEYINNI